MERRILVRWGNDGKMEECGGKCWRDEGNKERNVGEMGEWEEE